MATLVAQSYTAARNSSVTTRDGVITRVTLWTTGSDAKQTERIIGKGDPEYVG